MYIYIYIQNNPLNPKHYQVSYVIHHLQTLIFDLYKTWIRIYWPTSTFQRDVWIDESEKRTSLAVQMVKICFTRVWSLCVCVLVAQLCPPLCSPMDCSLPGSSVHGTLQTRILEWVAIPFAKDLPNPVNEPGYPTLLTDSLLSEPTAKPFDLDSYFKILDSWTWLSDFHFTSHFMLYNVSL